MLFGKDGEGRPLFLAEGNGFRFLARCVDGYYPNYRQACAPAPIQLGDIDCVKFRSAVKIFQAGIPRKEFPSQHLFLVFDADGSMYLCKSEGKKGILVGGSFTAETLRVRINPALFARVLPRAGRVLANARNKDSFMRDPLTFSYGQTTALVMPMCDSA
jgi:hypothetical protein